MADMMPAPPPLKPGFKSSETYLTLIGAILSVAVTYGVISATASKEVLDKIPDVITGIVALATIWKTIQTQVDSRTELKKAQIEATATMATAPIVLPIPATTGQTIIPTAKG